MLRQDTGGAAPPRRRRDAAGAVRQAGGRVQDPRGRAARADRQLQPGAALGDVGAFPRTRSQGPHDVRPDDGRQSGSTSAARASCREPTKPSLPWPTSISAADAAGPLDTDRRAGRHGRRAAAGRHHGRLLDASRSSATRRASTSACAPRYCRPQGDDARRSAGACSTKRRRPARPRLGRPARQCRRGLSRARCEARDRARLRHRPDLGPRPAQRLPAAGWTMAEWQEARRSATPDGVVRAAKNRWRCRCGPCSTSSSAAPPSSTTATTSARWRWKRASRTLSTSPASCRPTSGRCSARASGPFRWVRAVGRSRGHLQDRRQGQGADPRRSAPAPLARHGARAHRVPGPARAHLLGRRSRTARGSAWHSTRWCASGELKAPIVIGRDHLDSGSVASPNRETEAMTRRLGRGLRLAAAQRAAEHRGRRDLGLAASRRRRRHGLLAACRRGDRGRRHRRRGRAHGARAAQRSRPPGSCATPMRAMKWPSTAPDERAWTFPC